MSVRDHLCQVASRISDEALADVTSLEQWQAQRPQRYRRYLDMQGLPDGLPAPGRRSDLNVVVTGRLERDDVVIEKLHFQSMPGVYVTANLYLPARLGGPAPAVLYLCGHAPKQKVQYQPHPRRWAQLGFVCLIMDTIEFGEAPGDHHGPYSRGQFHWHSRGYNPGAAEMYNAIRAIDLLQQRDEVDGDRIGVTGISGGGGVTWWTAAADPRVKVAAPVCATTTLRSQVIDRCWDGQCDCLWFNNTWRWDLSEVAALVAPRPLMIASANRDQIFSIASIRECHQRVRRIYELYGSQDDCVLVETPGPHAYHPTSRKRIFAFFLQHLMGEDQPWEQIADVDDPREDAAALSVYVNGPPNDERTSTIQDDLLPRAPAPDITDRASFDRQRHTVVQALRQYTFGHFPSQPCDLQVQTAFEYEQEAGRRLSRISFVSEPGVSLSGRLALAPRSKAAPTSAVLHLHASADPSWDFESLTAGHAEAGRPCLTIEPRGTGETSWAQELDWHMRRTAVITGRTIASMQVYDALRGLEVLRSQEGVAADRVTVIGRGRMAVVALYAALLDGGVEAVTLVDPPATQDASDADGLPGIEMLNCLRFTDLPQVAGWIWPTRLMFVGHRPSAYAWAEHVHRILGGRVVHALTVDRYRRLSAAAD